MHVPWSRPRNCEYHHAAVLLRQDMSWHDGNPDVDELMLIHAGIRTPTSLWAAAMMS